MKILRYRKGNEIKPGILDQDEKIRDVSSLVKDWDDQNINVDNLNKISSEDLSSLPIIETIDSIAPCVKKNSIGINVKIKPCIIVANDIILVFEKRSTIAPMNNPQSIAGK